MYRRPPLASFPFGMRDKVLMGRNIGLFSAPSEPAHAAAGLVVMHEPTASLDFGNQAKVLECVRDLAKAGHAVVTASLWRRRCGNRFARELRGLHSAVSKERQRLLIY